MSSDHQLFGIEESIWRHCEIAWRWAFPDPAGGVVVRPVARAEPASKLPSRAAFLLTKGNAAQMRADPHDDQPFLSLDPVRIILGVWQDRSVICLCLGCPSSK